MTTWSERWNFISCILAFNSVFDYWNLSCSYYDKARQTTSIGFTVDEKWIIDQFWIMEIFFLNSSHPTVFLIMKSWFAHLAMKKDKQIKSTDFVIYEKKSDFDIAILFLVSGSSFSVTDYWKSTSSSCNEKKSNQRNQLRSSYWC